MAGSLDQAHKHFQQAEALFEKGNYSTAQKQYQRAFDLTRQASESGAEAARCQAGLGKALNALGDFPAARRLVEQALAAQNSLPGVGPADVAASLHTLGEILTNQGDLAGGLQRLEQAHTLRQETLGLAHPDTLDSLSLAAVCHMRLERRQQAEQLLTQALELAGANLEETHRITVKTLTRLGMLWASEKPPDRRSRPAYERALAASSQVFGPSHPYTALILNNLAALTADLDGPQAALPLQERSVQLHEQVYGPESPHTALTLANLAGLYKKLDSHPQACPLLVRALVICERQLDLFHAQTRRCLQDLMLNLHKLDETLRAGGSDPLLDLGIDPALPAMATTLHTLLMGLKAAEGTLSAEERRMAGAHLSPEAVARRLHEEVERLERLIHRPALSPQEREALRTAQALIEQARQRYEQSDDPTALALLEQALVEQEKILGSNHLALVEPLKLLSSVKERLGQFTAGLPLAERLAHIHTRVLGPGHVLTISALTVWMARLIDEYDLAAAAPLQRRILEIEEQALGSGDPSVERLRQSLLDTGTRFSTGVWQPPGPSRSEKRQRALASLVSKDLPVLAGIEQVDWRSLHHAYGPAVDLPLWLRLLLAEDQDVRNDALDYLYNTILHQGSLYPASAAAAPFLLRILAEPDPPGKTGLLYLLADLASSQAAQQDNEAKALGQILAAGLPLYIELLDHPEVKVGLAALWLLRCLGRRSPEIVSQLRAWLPGAASPLLQAGALFALRRHWTGDPGAALFFEGWLRPPGHRAVSYPLLAYQAAAGWIEHGAFPPPSAAVRTLRSARQAVETGEYSEIRGLAPWMLPDYEEAPAVQTLLKEK